MKKMFKSLLFIPLAIVGGTLLTGCAADNSGIEGNSGSTSYNLKVTSNDLTPKLNINSEANKTETVKVHFEGAEKSMRRLYITKNDGSGRVIYDINKNVAPPVSTNNDDSSINLKNEYKSTFTFDIPFEAPKNKGEVIVYKLWTTYSPFLNSKGDINNIEFRNSYKNIAVGTIVIKAGSGAVADSPVKEFSAQLAISLFAPDKYGKTKSFVSILNGQTYKIAQQDKDVTNPNVTFTNEEKDKNAQYVSYWDFGYFYTPSKGASLSSANDYMSAFTVSGNPVVNITNMSGLAQNELNKFYFKKDNTLNFNAFKKSNELSTLSVSTSSLQTINNLAVGDIIQFLDRNGVKGLIKINNIQEGTGNNDYIKFSVKVQNLDYVKL